MLVKYTRPLAGLLAAALAVSSAGTRAADLGYAAPAPYVAPVKPYSIVSEVRIGGSVQDPGGADGRGGSYNVNGEVLLAKPPVFQDEFWQRAIPRPTVGGSYNTDNRTSYAYIGATWTVDLFPKTLRNSVFLEGFFGAAAHNGQTGPKQDPYNYTFNALGCSPLFREAAALGFRLTEHWSVMATVEHMSNAGFCVNNRGLTNFGGKLGYTF